MAQIYAASYVHGLLNQRKVVKNEKAWTVSVLALLSSLIKLNSFTAPPPAKQDKQLIFKSLLSANMLHATITALRKFKDKIPFTDGSKKNIFESNSLHFQWILGQNNWATIWVCIKIAKLRIKMSTCINFFLQTVCGRMFTIKGQTFADRPGVKIKTDSTDQCSFKSRDRIPGDVQVNGTCIVQTRF